jgi:hypothetical protein
VVVGVAWVSQIAAQRDQMASLARVLEPGEVALFEAKSALADVVAIKHAAATVEALLSKRIADAGEWRRAGAKSAAEHLANTTGTTVGRAKDALATAQRLDRLGATAEAARSGALSPEQAAAISEAATADPGAERRLLDHAAGGGSLTELRDECERVKAAADRDPDETYRRNRASRLLRIYRGAGGIAKLFAQSTPDQIGRIQTAIETRADDLFHEARRAGRHEPREHYLIDALEHICTEWLADELDDSEPDTDDDGQRDGGDDHDDSGGGDSDRDAGDPRDETSATCDGAASAATSGDVDTARETGAGPNRAQRRKAKKQRRRQLRYMGLVRVDHAALVRGWTEDDEICEVAGLGPIPVRVARELLGDSLLYVLVTKGSAVATTVNLARGPTQAQRIALLWAQGIECQVEGCTNTIIQIDHTDDWAITHHTVLDELSNKCTYHHWLKTTQGWDLIAGTGKRPMVPPTDPRHPRHHHGARRVA